MKRAGAALLALAMLLAGCGADSAATDPSAAAFEFTYEQFGGEDSIDQALRITNRDDRAIALTLGFVALDEAGKPLPAVDVQTVYGRQEGDMIVPANAESIDILMFDGPGSDEVDDVRVTVEKAQPVSGPIAAYVPVDRIGPDGTIVAPYESYDKVRLTNDDDVPAQVRLVGIVWGRPAKGESQQALEVIPFGELSQVPAGESIEVAVPRDVQERAGSIKSYASR